MILAAAFSPSRLTFILDHGESEELGQLDTFDALQDVVNSEKSQESDYHLYILVDTSREGTAGQDGKEAQ